MNIRESILSGSWYPRDPAKIEEFLLPFRKNKAGTYKNAQKPSCRAAIAPHAGWFYSGRIAARSVTGLAQGLQSKEKAQTVVIIGGHLPAGMPVLMADEDAVRTPFGTMTIDSELMELFAGKLDARSDKYQDNTVEVLVPMVHCLFPGAKLLWARFPGDMTSFEAGKTLAEAGMALGRELIVLGSTDLTHYGANYAYSPKGRGKAALDWVRNTNDAAFINAVLNNDPALALRRADEDRSACSVGAVLGVMGYVEKCCEINKVPAVKGELLEYATSAEVNDGEIPDSFVGYASILWGDNPL